MCKDIQVILFIVLHYDIHMIHQVIELPLHLSSFFLTFLAFVCGTKQVQMSISNFCFLKIVIILNDNLSHMKDAKEII